MKGLMICHRIRLPYRVMRCMSAAGVEVYVLGNKLSKGLKYSRFCKKLITAEHLFDGSFSPEMVDEVNSYVKRLGIDIVFPGDALACRSFHGIKDQIGARSFPGPDLVTFDLLNNKWEFGKVAQELGILCPKTKLYETKNELIADFKSGAFTCPAIAKPLTFDGDRGIVKLTADGLDAQIESIFYDPILVQEFIDGEDIGASVYCTNGEIETFIAHELDQGIYSTFNDEGICETIHKVTSKFKLNGIYNFDMRRTPEGKIYYLECNPRYFFKMYLSMIAGQNFALPGVVPGTKDVPKRLPHNTATRTPRAWPSVLLRPWAITSYDRKLAAFLLGDPISYFRELTRIDWD